MKSVFLMQNVKNYRKNTSLNIIANSYSIKEKCFILLKLNLSNNRSLKHETSTHTLWYKACYISKLFQLMNTCNSQSAYELMIDTFYQL